MQLFIELSKMEKSENKRTIHRIKKFTHIEFDTS